jgi:hypothetical protein
MGGAHGRVTGGAKVTVALGVSQAIAPRWVT